MRVTVMTGAVDLTSGMNAHIMMISAATTVLRKRGEGSNPDSTSHLHLRAGNPTRMGIAGMSLTETETGPLPRWQVQSGNLARGRQQRGKATDKQPGHTPQPLIALTTTLFGETWHVDVRVKHTNPKKGK